MAQSAGNKAAAEAIFEQGKLLMQSGDYQQACLKFEASQKLDEGIGTLLYLADCYEKIGRTASAWAMFKEAASMAGAQGQESRQKLATQRAHTLESGLAKLTIDVARGNETLLGFEISNDGVTVPSAQYGAPVPVDPGEHKIEASAPGKRTYSEVVNLTNGTGHITVPLLTDLGTPAGESKATLTSVTSSSKLADSSMLTSIPRSSSGSSRDALTSAGRSQRVLSYVLGSVGLIGVGIGTYFGFTAMHSNTESKSQCNADNANLCPDQGVSLRNDALRDARISTAGFIAGGALLAAGAIFYFTAPDDKPTFMRAGTAFTPNSVALCLGGAF